VQDRSGNLAIFDDLGCMRVHTRTNAFELAGVFVRSFRTRGWVGGAAAWVVESRAFPSPMGYGVAAFEDERSAREEAARHPDAKVRPLTEYLSSSSLLSGGM